MGWEDELVAAIIETEEAKVLALVREKVKAGVPATEILADCNRAMLELGEQFAAGSCFIPELMFGGMVMKSVVAELKPLLENGAAPKSAGTVVMGTVQHDVHDVGKDIVVMMLRGVGFEVIDLGVNVPPEKFVEAAGRHRPAAMGMSVLLTTCFKSVTATVKAVEEAGLRDGLSLMVGGAAASDLLRENAGCDFYGKTAVDGVKFATGLLGVE